jgi:hypothetical protein
LEIKKNYTNEEQSPTLAKELDCFQGNFNQLVIDFSSSHTLKNLNVQQ